MTTTNSGRVGRPTRRRRLPAPRRRALSPIAGVALLALIAAGCSSASAGASGSAAASSSAGAGTDSRTTSLSQVTVHIGDQAGSGSQALLTAAGLIHKLPFKVTWSDFTSGPPMLQAMGAGAVDIGSVGNAPPVFAAAGGDSIAIVGALKANPLGSVSSERSRPTRSARSCWFPGARRSARSPSYEASASPWPRAAQLTTTCSPC